jgi:putative hydrolase of the HAD superfamily
MTPGAMGTGQALQGVKAVLFDLGGTLDAPGIPWKERLYRLYRAQGVGITEERFASVFYRVDDALVGAVPPALSLRDSVDELVAGLNDALELDTAGLAKRIAGEFYDQAMASARGNTPLLAQLSERYRLGVVSNFYGNLSTVCDELGLQPYLSVMVDSARVGCMKPDARIFQHALDELGVAPTAAAFVGDSVPRDMAGARAIGMAHVWLAGEAAGALEPCCPGDPVIRSLDTLRGLLL